LFGVNPLGSDFLGEGYAGASAAGADQLLTASAAGVATVTGSVVRTRALTATANGVATVTAAVARDRALTATAQGTATVAGIPTITPAAPTVVTHPHRLPVFVPVEPPRWLLRPITLEPAPIRAGASVTCQLTVQDSLDLEIAQLLALELIPA
jgi:hypothetical protein